MDDSYRHYSRVVDNYARYRPGYPDELVALLEAECGLAPGLPIADIGSGTGLLAEVLLRHGYGVAGVEPNDAMRATAEERLGAYPGFTSIAATAEATSLAGHSVQMITVGNAFHWFNHAQVRPEFARILVPAGWVALVWNLEWNDGSPFAVAFEQFWQRHIDPDARFIGMRDRRLPGYIPQFFAPGAFKQSGIETAQVCDLAALKGLALSTIKAPQPDDPRHAPMAAELEAIFNQFHQDGTVTLHYDTAVIYGQLSP
jgi:SAM-dependent methyltransferase